MQVSVENTGPLERRIRVEVPEEKIANEVENRLQSISRTTRIQGFRPGKAPLKVVEKHYGNRVRKEVLGEVMQSSFYEAINQENLRPAGNPTIDPMNAGKGQGLVYTATFEIYPEISLSPFKDLKIKKPVCQVTDKDVDKMIEVIRNQHNKLIAVDRKAKKGDVLKIDFKGTIDDEPFEGGESKGFQYELGSNRFLPEFEKALQGVLKGQEVTINMVFPEDYHKEELRNKPAVFKVNVLTVSESVPAELNNELFQVMGVKDGGLEEFKKQVHQNMERESEHVLANKTKIAVLDALFAANEIELPGTLVKNESTRIREQFYSNLKSQGLVTDKLPEQDDSLFRERAEKNVTLQLLITDIVRKNEIKANPSKVRQIIEQVAEGYKDPNEVVNWYYSDKKRLAEVEALALEDEVVDWILSKAHVSENKLSFDDLMNKGQTGIIEADQESAGS